MIKKLLLSCFFGSIALTASASTYWTNYKLVITNNTESKQTICVVAPPWTSNNDCKEITPGNTTDLGSFKCGSNSMWNDPCNPRYAEVYRVSTEPNGAQTKTHIGQIKVQAYAACMFGGNDSVNVTMDRDLQAVYQTSIGGSCEDFRTRYHYVNINIIR